MQFLRKRIKNLNLKIYPPYGEVRITAPLRLSFDLVKKFISSKINWIKKQQLKISKRPRAAALKFINDEIHYLWGEKYHLQIIENSRANSVKIKEDKIELHLKKAASLEQKRKILDEFYRAQIKKIIPKLIAKYEKKMAVKVSEFGVKKMKTRWGTCNTKARRIWLNLELVKRKVECLEFIVVHEMTHILERHHNKRFFDFMDQFMPGWKEWQNLLKERGF